MHNTLHVTTKNGESVPLTLKYLDKSYLPQILDLQQCVIDNLPDSSWFAPTSSAEFDELFQEKGTILGYLTPDLSIAALGVYAKYSTDKSNYGYDLELDTSLLDSVGHIECTIVEENFRGNRLQSFLCEALEEIGSKNSTPLMCATVHPDNHYSLNTLLRHGYVIKKEKVKYGGLRRYVLLKVLL